MSFIKFPILFQQRNCYYLCLRQLHLSNILEYGRFPYFNIHKNVTDPARQDPDYFEKEAEKLPLEVLRYMDKLKDILIKSNLIFITQNTLLDTQKFYYRRIYAFESALDIIKEFNFVYISSGDNFGYLSSNRKIFIKLQVNFKKFRRMERENRGNFMNEETSKSEEPINQKSKKVEDLPLGFCDYIMLAFLLTWVAWPFFGTYNYLHFDWDKIHEDFINRKIEEKRQQKIKNEFL